MATFYRKQKLAKTTTGGRSGNSVATARVAYILLYRQR